MQSALWVSKTGLSAQDVALRTISNNLANVSTVGFKRDRAVFEDLIYQNVRQAGASSTEDTELPSGLYIGTGVSGGEEGARHGPSIMPGGSPDAWPHVKSIFQSISAKVEDGSPCCEWLGNDGAGHFVKMVHNGVEYGIMQAYAEGLNHYAALHPDEVVNPDLYPLSGEDIAAANLLIVPVPFDGFGELGQRP